MQLQNQTPHAQAPTDFRFTVPISKVDKAKRLITGVATAEVLDAHGQIVDYESAKRAFGEWKGNIREMHQPVAVGKAVDITFDDAGRQIFVTSYISKGAQDTWEKIQDGTLSMYSIGARGTVKTEKLGDKTVERIIVSKQNELSVVDNGACPTADFSIVKMSGDAPELAQTFEAGDVEPADAPAAPVAPAEPEPAAAPPVTKTIASPALLRALLASPRAERIAKLDQLDIASADVVIAKRVEYYDIRNALACIGFLEELVSSEIWEAKDLEMAGRTLTSEDTAQLDLLRNASELLLAFLISEFQSQFDDAPDGTAAAAVENMQKAVGTTRLLAALARTDARTALIEKVRGPVLSATLEQTAIPTDFTKLQADLATATTALTEAQTTIAAQAESIVAVTKRLETLEAQPMPGGPVTRAGAMEVRKQLGNATDETEGVDPAEVVKALTQLAGAATTDAERSRITEKLLAFQMKHGLGRTVITRQGQ